MKEQQNTLMKFPDTFTKTKTIEEKKLYSVITLNKIKILPSPIYYLGNNFLHVYVHNTSNLKLNQTYLFFL